MYMQVAKINWDYRARPEEVKGCMCFVVTSYRVLDFGIPELYHVFLGLHLENSKEIMPIDFVLGAGNSRTDIANHIWDAMWKDAQKGAALEAQALASLV